MNNIFNDENSRPASGNNIDPSLFQNTVSGQNAQGSSNAQTPLYQLTTEQLSELVKQILAAGQAQANQNVKPAQPEAKPAPQPYNASDPGKRIVYQSPDFDNQNSVPIETEPEQKSLMDVIERDSELKKSFYDDDEVFDAGDSEETVLNIINNPASSVRITDFGENFSISEADYSETELPKIAKKKVIENRAIVSLIPEKSAKQEEETLSFPFSKQASDEARTVQPEAIPKKIANTSMEIDDYEEIIEKSSKRKKKLPVSEIIRRSVLCVSLFAIIVASCVLIREYKLHNDNKKLEEDISNLILPEDEISETQDNDKPENVIPGETDPALSEQEQWQQLREQYPNVIFPPALQLKYAKLYATNQDFVGYLSADGIGMSLPIVQATDDEKYLNKNFYGKTTKYGCPFVTHLNNIASLDMNTVIFGHHMNDGTVFGILDKYKTIDGFKNAPVITFNTINGNYQWKVIAAFITNAYEKDDNGYVFQYYFTSVSSTERFSAYLNELSQRSLYDTGVDVFESDKLLTLSTCSHEFEDARFVVVARLVRPGESANVNTENAVVNANPRYPQAYCSKKKIKNAYADASRWYVG